MKQILYIIYYVLIVFSFITAFSFALATVLWLYIVKDHKGKIKVHEASEFETTYREVEDYD